jgi:hypothetical protein
MLLSAGPALALVIMMYRWFRGDGASVRTATLLAGAFALGSLLWPYAGMIFNHLMAAALLFGAWMLLDGYGPTRQRALFAGLLLGLAALVEYMAGPLVLLFVIYEYARRRDAQRIALLCAGPALALGTLLLYHQINFGDALTPSYAYDNPLFMQQGLVMGKFHLPEWRRLHWLTYGRMRGLFVCCPLFVLPIISALVALHARRMRFDVRSTFGLWIVGYFTALLLCYAYWAGGSGVGPRFFIPATPFLFIYARRAIEDWPRVSGVLVGLSILNMFAVTAVRALYPGNDHGPPMHFDPIGVCLLDLLWGQVALEEGSFNLGQLIGLRGWASLIPVLGLIGAGLAMLRVYLRSTSAALASGSAAPAQRLYISPDGCNPSSATSDLNSRDNGVTST